MSDRARKRRDFIQNITIALLSVTAVLLFAQTQIYGLGLNSGLLSFLSGSELPANPAGPDQAGAALTAPVRVTGIILGKYFAVLTLLLAAVIITFLQAAVLSLYGDVSWITVLTGGLGYFLVGASLLAIGLFISSITESQMIAAGISFGVVLLCMLLPNLSDIVPGRARYTYIVCGAVVLLLAWFFLEQTKSIRVGALVAVIGAAVLGVCAWQKPEIFDNGLSKIIDWFSIMDRFNDFCSGILNASSVVYYLSFIAVFLFLSVQTMEKRRWN